MKQLTTILFSIIGTLCGVPGAMMHTHAQCQPWQLYPDKLFTPCGTNCTQITLNLPQLKSTEAYTVKEISYQPLAFSAGSATELTQLYQADNRFSAVQQIGFPVSFYGNNYTSFVVGNNGVVSFNTALAGCTNAAVLTSGTQPQPLPFSGGAACGPTNTVYYPGASVFVYHNLDASAPGGPGKRIEWRTEGTAPCRKLVISFNEIALQNARCAGLWSSFQIVMYEHSGQVDVFVKNKPTCAGNIDNLAVLGLQNATQTAAITPPGKNAAMWAESQTAYSFTPNGSASLWQSVILEKNGTTQATGTGTGTANGQLQIKFSPYCFTTGSDSLLLTGRYATATGTASFTLSDTVFLNKNVQSFSVTAAVSKSVCTNANGAVTVQLPPLADPAQYQYAINLSGWQSNNVFTGLVPGNYLIKARDITGTCSFQMLVNVADTNPVTASYDIANATCTGLLNGSVTAQAYNGYPPYRYSFDNSSFGANNVFTGLGPATYRVKIIDSLGCTREDDVAVRPGTAVNFTATVTPAYCDNTATGTITVQVLSGTPPYQYAIDNGSFQSSPVFTQLLPEPQLITVKDGAGCVVTYAVDVPAGAGIQATATAVNASCYTAANGSITVQASGGVAPYLYALNSLPFQATSTFANLRPGLYQITIKDDLGCTVVIEKAVLTNNGTIIDVSAGPPTCSVTSDGGLTVIVSGGVPPYRFKLNNGPWQTSNQFTGLAMGFYIVTVEDAAGCVNALSKELLPGEPFEFFPVSTNTTCYNDTAVISVPAILGNGVPPYQYAFTATGMPVYQNSSSASITGPGSWLVYVKDSRGCVVIRALLVEQLNTIALNVNTTPSSCNLSADGGIEAVSNNNGNYRFTISGPSGYQSSPVFTNLSPQTYTLLVKDSLCITRVDVDVSPGPEIVIQADMQPETCPGIGNGSITLTPVVATPPVRYRRSTGPYQTGNVFTGLFAGIHKIYAIDALGCTDSLTVEVTSNQIFDFTTTATPSTCVESTTGQISITVLNPGTYNLRIRNGPWQTSPVFDNLPAGTYEVSVRDATFCTKTKQVVVSAGPGISASLVITQPITCTQTTGTITINSSNARPPVMYSINNGAFVASNQFSGLPVGNYVFRVRDADNCTALLTASLVIPPEPVMNLALIRPCNGLQNGQIDAVVTGGTAPFNYSLNSGPFGGNSQFTMGAGTYRIVLKDALDCQTEKTVRLLQHAPLALEADLRHAGCLPTNNGAVMLRPLGDGSIFKYSVNSGPFAPGNPIDLPPGAYRIQAKDEFGCISEPLAVTLGTKNTIALAIPADTVICEGSPFLINTVSNATQFNWQPASGLNDSQLQSPLATLFANTNYSVVATLGNCQLTRFIDIGVKPAPVAFAGRDTMVCFGQPRPLAGSGGVGFRWRPASGLSNTQIANPVFTGDQTSTYYLQVTGANGCTSLAEDTVTITRLLPVPAFAGRDTVALAGQPHQLQATGGLSYSWSPAFYLNNSNIANPVAIITQDQRFSVMVTDTNGCRAADDIVLKIYGPMVFPSAFTPNGDGLNDLFKEAGGNSLKQYLLRVFNRYGKLVFETTQQGQGWNGEFKQLAQPGGTYVYEAEAYDTYLKQRITLKGTVVLVR